MNGIRKTGMFLKRHPVATLLVLLLLGGGGYFALKKKPVPQLPSAAQGSPTTTAKVEKADITEKISETASLAPLSVVRIKANATGMVSRLLVEEGDKVTQNELLAVIQPGRPGEKYRPSSVLAPLSGIVLERNVEAGDIVTSGLSEFNGGTQLMALAKLDVMQANFEINEVDIAKVKPGMQATLRLEALPEKSFNGTIRSIAPMAKRGDGSNVSSFAAKVLVSGSHPELKPGMSALVEVITDTRKAVLSLPVEAVFDDGGDSATAYRREGLELKKVTLRTGLYDNHRVEILSGLKEGDTVSTVRPLADMPPRK